MRIVRGCDRGPGGGDEHGFRPAPNPCGEAPVRCAILGAGRAPTGRPATCARDAGQKRNRLGGAGYCIQPNRGGAQFRREHEYRRGEAGSRRHQPDTSECPTRGGAARRQGCAPRLADGASDDRGSHARRGRHACADRNDRPQQCFSKTLIVGRNAKRIAAN
jgi:hypothetical protein